ncbi:MAG: dehydrogenase [Sphingomonas sp. 28-62-20]|uniref:Gfo/Idh/MocA family protein n=1 Tax=Sphingomonas sp. 28-62-20 TaxID=1970433 RepID=UPI000BD26D83|nr:MAG: dehydrogenase [Sphingomonas sp. 28-62-20]
MTDPLRIGFIGAGFIAHFHLGSFEGVRDAVIAGVYSPTPAKRQALADRANALGLGPCRAFDSLAEMLASGEVDAVWVLSPNDVRIETFTAIRDAVKSGASIRAIACEKPLGRTLAEAEEVLRLTEEAGLAHGYLENQVFSTAVQRGKEIIWRRAVPSAGRPYLARAAEEHAGPHEPWFWDGKRQGGGVLSDMMCHSIEVGRFLLSAPDEPRAAMQVKSVNGTIGHLKWTRPRYAAELGAKMAGVDYRARASEDFARGLVTLEDPEGQEAVIEATTSWAYVGAGLRIDLELMGPEYAMQFSSLGAGLKLFLSRAIEGGEGEDLVEKQNAETGLMPVIDDEAGVYGYTLENRHMVHCFRTGTTPIETFHDGVEVTRIIMALYKSAEEGRVIHFPDDSLRDYVPVPARG